jgi:hypothetical protein
VSSTAINASTVWRPTRAIKPERRAAYTAPCAEGARVFDRMLDEVDEKIFEVSRNQN